MIPVTLPRNSRLGSIMTGRDRKMSPAIDWDRKGPVVTHIHKGRPRVRGGRGFSLAELRSARVSLDRARTLKIPIDLRRKTVYESNVEVVRTRAQEFKPEESGSKTHGGAS